MLGTKQVTAPALEWGKANEEVALQQYERYQHSAGHSHLFSCRSGFIVSDDYPFLGASPDTVVYDPDTEDPFGLAEIKCPYSVRFITPAEACSHKDFFCWTLETSTNTGQHQLRKRILFSNSRADGYQMVRFCHIHHQGAECREDTINFDTDFWNNELLPKLTNFYDNCLALEIVSPIHVLGIPVWDLRKM